MGNREIAIVLDDVKKFIKSKPANYKLGFCELCDALPDYDPELLNAACLVLADSGLIDTLTAVDMSGNVSVACIYA